MKRSMLTIGACLLAVALSGCSTFGGRDCGACCKGVSFNSTTGKVWEACK